MRQSPKEKRLIPKNLAERSDHEIMEIALGKRAMKHVDRWLDEHNHKPHDTEPKKSP